MKSQPFIHKPKVFVGLSGGVDSAVSAALLKKQGYGVTGVFIKAWVPPRGFYPAGSQMDCTWKEDRRSAMRVCAVLDIPFITLDLEKEYKRDVVDYMIREYEKGNTPNPDVMCNKEIKFGAFLDWALKQGADYIATGHYARTSPRPRKLGLPLSLSRRGERGEVLMEGIDKNKDQSYFLWTLTQEELKHTLFPVGDLEKSEVRKLASKFGLPQATRKDSQGLCFLGQIDMKEFLKNYIRTKKGKVLNEKGEVIGEHDGAILYTIGERHGFTITKKSDKEVPLYVIAKNVKKNTLTVGRKLPLKQLASQEVILKEVNLIQRKIDTSKKYSARIRYRQEKTPCTIMPITNKSIRAKDKHSHILKNVRMLRVEFKEEQFGLSPGQSLVLYLPAQAGNDEICLGGGIIS